MSAAVDVQELSKSFRTREPRGPGLRARVADAIVPRVSPVHAINRISFRIETGERVAFIGPNGAGKSTTLKILSGILTPSGGNATVAGLVPWRDRRVLGFAIGTVFGQRSQLWYQLAPRDTMELLASVYELPRDVWRARLDALVDAFELAPLLDRPIRQLSLGERMRCEVAASLLHAPRVLFLDEPTIGLDVSAKATIRELLHLRSTEDGTTLLLTSHDTGDIEQVCDRVIIIHRGRVLLDVTVGDTLGDVAVLYGIVAVAHGLAVFVAGGIQSLARLIHDGELDALIAQPKPTLLYAVGLRSQPSGLGDIVSGLVMIALSGRVTPTGIPIVIVAGIAGALVLVATAVLLHSAAFWLGRTEAASRQLYEVTLMFSLYPDTLFTGPMRWILFTVIPAGFVGYLPADLIRTPTALTATAIAAGVTAYAAFAAWVFDRGLRAYSSGSRFATFG